MAKPTFAAPPAAPVRASSTFETDVGAFLTWLRNYQPELVTAIDWIETQLTTVQGAETTSTTKASEAAASATAAASSATAAQTAKDGAQGAQSAAQTAQTGAETANSQFKAIWCGAGSTAPTVDGNGNPLTAGCLWFDASANVMRAYNGSAWVASAVDANGALVAANNLSDLPNKAAARANLGVPALASNLSDLPNKAAARANLGVTEKVVAMLSHEEPLGVGGGDIYGGWMTRKINVINHDPQGAVTLASNAFTFSVAGMLFWSAPSYYADHHQTRLVRIHDGSVISYGSSGYAAYAGYSRGQSPVAAGVAYRLEHQCSRSGTNRGGAAVSAPLTKGVFTQLYFEK